MRKFPQEDLRNEYVTMGSDEVDLNERAVGSDLPNESHNKVEEHGPLSAMQELHPSNCARAKECYPGLSLPHEQVVVERTHIENFDRANQGSAKSTLPDKQITTQELHPSFSARTKEDTLVYLYHTWLLRKHALKSLIRPIKAMQNQPKRVTPIKEEQNQIPDKQIKTLELHPSFFSRTKEDCTGSSLPHMVAKKAHIEKIDRINQGCPASTYQKRPTKNYILAIVLEPKRVAPVYLHRMNTRLLRKHIKVLNQRTVMLKIAMQPSKVVLNQVYNFIASLSRVAQDLEKDYIAGARRNYRRIGL